MLQESFWIRVSSHFALSLTGRRVINDLAAAIAIASARRAARKTQPGQPTGVTARTSKKAEEHQKGMFRRVAERVAAPFSAVGRWLITEQNPGSEGRSAPLVMLTHAGFEFFLQTMLLETVMNQTVTAVDVTTTTLEMNRYITAYTANRDLSALQPANLTQLSVAFAAEEAIRNLHLDPTAAAPEIASIRLQRVTGSGTVAPEPAPARAPLDIYETWPRLTYGSWGGALGIAAGVGAGIATGGLGLVPLAGAALTSGALGASAAQLFVPSQVDTQAARDVRTTQGQAEGRYPIRRLPVTEDVRLQSLLLGYQNAHIGMTSVLFEIRKYCGVRGGVLSVFVSSAVLGMTTIMYRHLRKHTRSAGLLISSIETAIPYIFAYAAVQVTRDMGLAINPEQKTAISVRLRKDPTGTSPEFKFSFEAGDVLLIDPRLPETNDLRDSIVNQLLVAIAPGFIKVAFEVYGAMTGRGPLGLEEKGERVEQPVEFEAGQEVEAEPEPEAKEEIKVSARPTPAPLTPVSDQERRASESRRLEGMRFAADVVEKTVKPIKQLPEIIEIQNILRELTAPILDVRNPLDVAQQISDAGRDRIAAVTAASILPSDRQRARDLERLRRLQAMPDKRLAESREQSQLEAMFKAQDVAQAAAERKKNSDAWDRKKREQDRVSPVSTERKTGEQWDRFLHGGESNVIVPADGWDYITTPLTFDEYDIWETDLETYKKGLSRKPGVLSARVSETKSKSKAAVEEEGEMETDILADVYSPGGIARGALFAVERREQEEEQEEEGEADPFDEFRKALRQSGASEEQISKFVAREMMERELKQEEEKGKASPPLASQPSPSAADEEDEEQGKASPPLASQPSPSAADEDEEDDPASADLRKQTFSQQAGQTTRSKLVKKAAPAPRPPKSSSGAGAGVVGAAPSPARQLGAFTGYSNKL
jgi:hypothetical protein